jgi:hypothetical protein
LGFVQRGAAGRAIAEFSKNREYRRTMKRQSFPLFLHRSEHLLLGYDGQKPALAQGFACGFLDDVAHGATLDFGERGKRVADRDGNRNMKPAFSAHGANQATNSGIGEPNVARASRRHAATKHIPRGHFHYYLAGPGEAPGNFAVPG